MPTRSEARQFLAATRSTCAAVRWRDPSVVPLPWQLELGAACDALVDVALSPDGWARTTLAAPPRHGKTEHVGVGMPLSAMLRAAREGRPLTVLYATSAGERADEVSVKVRGAIRRAHRLTGDDAFAPGDIWQRTAWQTKGGLRWTALGWTASTGGVDADLLVMDDLIGSSQVYRSRSSREQIRRVVQEDLLSRKARVAVQMETRRGIEDTTAWLEREFGDVWQSRVWRCHDETRGYLWPEMYGDAWRAANPHLTDSSPIWRSLYQQEPVPEGGTLIDPEWLTRTYPESPAIAARLADRIVIGVDLAVTGKTTSDYCAAVVLGVRGAHRDVLQVVRQRLGPLEQRAMLVDLCSKWKPSDVLVEEAAGGHRIVEDLRAAGVSGVRGQPPRGDKVTRLAPHLGAIAADLRMPYTSEPWALDFRDELSSFTGRADAHDDQVDALVWAMVAAAPVSRAYTWDEMAGAW